MRVFLDTSVFLYAVGAEHHYRKACREILFAAGIDRFEAVVNVEVLQEYTHVRSRKGVLREAAAVESTDIVSTCRVQDVDMATLQVALQLFVATPELELRDAIHAATAISQLVDGVVSSDRGFDSIPGMLRLDPIDFAATLSA